MTIHENSIEINSKKIPIVDKERVSLGNKGVTMEQLLLNDLKIIAQDYLDIEELKKSLSKIILKNKEDINFSSFKDFPRFYIK